jgi:hypothetical protein
MRDPQECRSLARKCRERAKLQSSETLLIRCNFERSSWPIKPTKPSGAPKTHPVARGAPLMINFKAGNF